MCFGLNVLTRTSENFQNHRWITETAYAKVKLINLDVPLAVNSIVKKKKRPVLKFIGIGIGILFLLVLISSYLGNNNLTSGGCGKFYNVINDHLQLPPSYEVVSRNIIECAGPDHPSNDAGYMFQSSESDTSVASLEQKLTSILTDNGWTVATDAPDKSGPILSNTLYLSLKVAPQLTGSVTIVSTKPNTLSMRFSVPTKVAFPSTKSNLKQVKPTAEEIISKAPFKVYEPAYLPSGYKGRFSVSTDIDPTWTVYYRATKGRFSSADVIDMNFNNVTEGSSPDVHCSVPDCAVVENTNIGQLYGAYGTASWFLRLDHTDIQINEVYTNQGDSKGYSKSELIKTVESLHPVN